MFSRYYLHLNNDRLIMQKPLITLPNSKNILRILLLTTVIFALLMGLFQELYRQENKKYLKLEDMFVRVRTQLGREETQRLIDQSYNK